VEQYLVFAEGQAMRRVPMYMKDWITKLNGFLQLNDRNILEHAGKISHEIALEKAQNEYDTFHKIRIENHTESSEEWEAKIKQLKPPKK
jgi:hypothetical protein